MITSRSTSTLAKPAGDEPVPLGTLGYFRARNRGRVHDVVLKEFKRSGITRATLARRLGKRPEVISRMLGGPGNWTLDTYSDLLFAIAGGEAEYGIGYPLDAVPRNQHQPEWLPEWDLKWIDELQRESAQQQKPPAFDLSNPPAPKPSGLLGAAP